MHIHAFKVQDQLAAAQSMYYTNSGVAALNAQGSSGRKRRYRRTIGTVDGCRTAGGRSSDGRRTVVGGARVVSGAEKKII